MKKLMWIMSIAPLVITAIVLQFMPERVPMHYDMAGNVDRWGSRYESLLERLSLFSQAFLRSLPRYG